MDFFSAEFFTTLAAIVLIDIVLAGDNAIVIALAARNLPPAIQKKAILWGTVGAIVVRILMTLIVVWLLELTGLHHTRAARRILADERALTNISQDLRVLMRVPHVRVWWQPVLDQELETTKPFFERAAWLTLVEREPGFLRAALFVPPLPVPADCDHGELRLTAKERQSCWYRC